MTMPNESTGALLFAAEFLQELRFADDNVPSIRRKATYILRYFPGAWNINLEARRKMSRAADEPWLLPIDLYDRKVAAGGCVQEAVLAGDDLKRKMGEQ